MSEVPDLVHVHSCVRVTRVNCNSIARSSIQTHIGVRIFCHDQESTMHWLEDENLERIACVTPLKRHRPPWSIAIPFTKSSSTRAMVACFLAPHTEPLWHGIAKGVFELVDLNQVALVVVIMYSLHHDTDMLDVVSKKSNTSNRSLGV